MANSDIDRDVSRAVHDALNDLLPTSVCVECSEIDDHRDRLSPAELAIVNRAIDRRQCEFSTGRFLARKALSSFDIIGAEILQGDQRRPLWPVGISGGITHSSGICAVAVARTDQTPVLGIDIEKISTVPVDILKFIASAEEQELLADRLPPQDLTAALFSIREAIFKAYYPETGYFLRHKDVFVDLKGEDFAARITASDAPPLMMSPVINGKLRFTAGMVVSTVALEAL